MKLEAYDKLKQKLVNMTDVVSQDTGVKSVIAHFPPENYDKLSSKKAYLELISAPFCNKTLMMPT